MRIEYENYVIEQTVMNRFDLLEKVEAVKKATKEKYDSEYVLAYGVRLDRAVELIIHDKLKRNKSVVTLNEFLREYKKERNKIFEIIDL